MSGELHLLKKKSKIHTRNYTENILKYLSGLDVKKIILWNIHYIACFGYVFELL